MKRSIKHFIEDAIEYCKKAQVFTKDMTYEDFNSDEKTFMAVTRALELVGEALKTYQKALKQNTKGFHGKKLSGFETR